MRVAVAAQRESCDDNDVQAMLYRTLESAADPSEETLQLLAAVNGQQPLMGDDDVTRWLRLCAVELFGIGLPVS